MTTKTDDVLAVADLMSRLNVTVADLDVLHAIRNFEDNLIDTGNGAAEIAYGCVRGQIEVADDGYEFSKILEDVQDALSEAGLWDEES